MLRDLAFRLWTGLHWLFGFYFLEFAAVVILSSGVPVICLVLFDCCFDVYCCLCWLFEIGGWAIAFWISDLGLLFWVDCEFTAFEVLLFRVLLYFLGLALFVCGTSAWLAFGLVIGVGWLLCLFLHTLQFTCLWIAVFIWVLL